MRSVVPSGIVCSLSNPPIRECEAVVALQWWQQHRCLQLPELWVELP
jgi:hypothetical protein